MFGVTQLSKNTKVVEGEGAGPGRSGSEGKEGRPDIAPRDHDQDAERKTSPTFIYPAA
jgi:hypothetical protein